MYIKFHKIKKKWKKNDDELYIYIYIYTKN